MLCDVYHKVLESLLIGQFNKLPPPGPLALSYLFTTLSFIYCPLTFIYCPLTFLPIGSRHRTDYKVRFYLPNTRSKSALHKETSFSHNSNMICYFTSLFLTQKIATCNKGCSRNYPGGAANTFLSCGWRVSC